MAVITANIFVNNRPVRRAYVEHVGPFGLGSLGVTITDDAGAFTIDAGIASNAADIKVHCQNSVIRVVHGSVVNAGIAVGGRVSHGSRFSIPANDRDHFEILNECLDVYDVVWRQFKPFSNRTRRGFALGRRDTLRQTLASNKRLELSYPDQFPSELAFVEPAGMTNDNYPLAHIKRRDIDGRLFGERDALGLHDRSLLPHEMGHVFHFAAMRESTRIATEGGYIAYLLSRIPAAVAAGNTVPFTHNVAVATNPLVALLEAIGLFSERFYAFSRLRAQRGMSGTTLRRAFVDDEVSAAPQLSTALRDPYVQVAARDARGRIRPSIPTGPNVEGAVYGAIFLDLGSRLGLKRTVEALLASNAQSFDDFATYVSATLNPGRELGAVKVRWGL